ncbi:hypothetical protein C882_0618 [Caenispirillum salinarum AK4]|uniref:Uncharacterized protein n=1 Tax=Caenispirillum salinarum AK4 TaxID=1238182 RepID=K9HL60_9PROT|nr:hypothetical protein C882_0618 [Caenispirillum salinarum AK4]
MIERLETDTNVLTVHHGPTRNGKGRPGPGSAEPRAPSLLFKELTR